MIFLMKVIITSILITLWGYPIGKVDSTTTFNEISSFPASAGIGDFNASLAGSWTTGAMDIETSAQIMSIFADGAVTYQSDPVSVACSSSDCLSLLFVGGLGFVQPDPNLLTQSPNANVIIIHGEQGFQGDYWSVNPAEEPFDNHCQTWGVANVAFMVCIKVSSLDPKNLIAAIV
jgi:hypothetical protein